MRRNDDKFDIGTGVTGGGYVRRIGNLKRIANGQSNSGRYKKCGNGRNCDSGRYDLRRGQSDKARRMRSQ